MSELIHETCSGNVLRERLLATVSTFALLTAVCTMPDAQAADTFLAGDHPVVWIELGGQLDQLNSSQEPYVPDFAALFHKTEAGPFAGTGAALQKPPAFSYGFEGKVSFLPANSDWLLSASVQYGRGLRTRTLHEQYIGTAIGGEAVFYDEHVRSTEQHLILDFKAGRDVGLGVFGSHALLSAGIRVARFQAHDSLLMTSVRPGGFDYNVIGSIKPDLSRSLTAIGPTVSFDGSTHLSGPSDEGVSFDWGANGAILFGRQKLIVHQSGNARYYNPFGTHPLYASNSTIVHAKQVVVPNVGGTLGFSYKWPAAKVSIGYRADAFFNAFDGGIPGHYKSADRSFYGPFVTISIGLGG